MTASTLNYKDIPSNTGILICGHGSRNPIAIKEFELLIEKLKHNMPGIPVSYGFLEFNRPIIREALDNLRSQGVERVVALPAMLFAAAHAKNDIPSLLNSYSAKTGLLIEYGRELGINTLMIGAAGERVRETIKKNLDFPCSETLLVVVGRGSSDPDANSNVSKITRMLVEGFGFGWGETVFSGVTFPLVEPGLRYCLKLGFKRIIVFPYFLFNGLLINRVRKYIDKIEKENDEVEFLTANYLSDHPLVVKTFLERINEVLNGDNAMNCSLCKYRSALLGFESEVGHIQASHHHHVEGCLDKCKICGEISCDCFSTLEQKDIRLLDTHEHHHFTYPHSGHPLGPITLKNENES